MHIAFWWEIQKERDQYKDFGRKWEDNIVAYFRKAITVEPAGTAVARVRLCKHIHS
jgi:hypothetical protein